MTIDGQRLTCRTELEFADGTMKPGEVVVRREPTDYERKDKGDSCYIGSLEEDVKRQWDKSDPPAWIVVDWNGKRRRVPMRAFRQ